eukprot:1161562-Pelagomonas_calceolata.AAC.5
MIAQVIHIHGCVKCNVAPAARSLFNKVNPAARLEMDRYTDILDRYTWSTSDFPPWFMYFAN